MNRKNLPIARVALIFVLQLCALSTIYLINADLIRKTVDSVQEDLIELGAPTTYIAPLVSGLQSIASGVMSRTTLEIELLAVMDALMLIVLVVVMRRDEHQDSEPEPTP
jgi:hypothetical protein